MHSNAVRETLERGVYRAPYQMNGCGVLFAVTSRGERLQKIVVLRPGVSEARAMRWLEEVLDRVDPPRPPLRLLPPTPPPRQIPVERIDALYRDASPVAAALWKRKRDRYRGNESH
ncbi:MAG: hypothetical protein HOQ12_01840 [Gemmatimonadaceae bacterium]|nr:hypothetical protein [Gemmatimonadaceae bacterium]NUR18254.1 hypothetical protein [Gemmatimonadaceae bacterium]